MILKTIFHFDMNIPQGTDALLEYAELSRKTAEEVRSFASHRVGAELLEVAAELAEKLAEVDTDIQVEKGEN